MRPGSAGGAYVLLERVVGRGCASPLHVHGDEDEAFFVMDGGLRVVVDGEERRASAGAMAALPRRLAHSFVVTGPEARFLALHTPVGFDAFVAGAGIPADVPAMPPEAALPPDLAALTAAAARYGVETIGPRPRSDLLRSGSRSQVPDLRARTCRPGARDAGCDRVTCVQLNGLLLFWLRSIGRAPAAPGGASAPPRGAPHGGAAPRSPAQERARLPPAVGIPCPPRLSPVPWECFSEGMRAGFSGPSPTSPKMTSGSASERTGTDAH
ncbi:cupin domain-containing protein [Streptomyces sp. NPDC001380]|uniref:cupin domain-containing protein n=1 Tax=Streptomyces sp. NPDC001380 TaxID=3364566 RepID=UPI003677983E